MHAVWKWGPISKFSVIVGVKLRVPVIDDAFRQLLSFVFWLFVIKFHYLSERNFFLQKEKLKKHKIKIDHLHLLFFSSVNLFSSGIILKWPPLLQWSSHYLHFSKHVITKHTSSYHCTLRNTNPFRLFNEHNPRKLHHQQNYNTWCTNLQCKSTCEPTKATSKKKKRVLNLLF